MLAEGKDACLRVALASYDPRALRVQKRFLEEQCSFLRCTGYRRGWELLERLRQGSCYDVIVLGSQLEDMDEAEFLTHLRHTAVRPLLLLFGEGRHSENALSCLRADGGCYIARQTELKDLLEELYRASGRSAVQLDALCGRLYAEWGVQSPDTKCAYLTSAVRIACGTPERLAIRKELLRPVSEEYHVSVAAVDSGLRRLIDECEARSTAGWRAFRQAAGFGGKKPTTGKLIYAVRDQLRLRGLE